MAQESFLSLGASGSPVLGGFKLGSSAEVFSAKASIKHLLNGKGIKEQAHFFQLNHGFWGVFNVWVNILH